MFSEDFLRIRQGIFLCDTCHTDLGFFAFKQLGVEIDLAPQVRGGFKRDNLLHEL
nr:MAG TPA: hypothetical protein [Caudoviricetes sp.]